MCKISVIIPVWNAGEKIRRCLDSLLSQSLNDMEFICVIDCPTDGTEKLVEEYAKKDHRIRVIYNTENLHVAASRNKGIQIAKGEYIGFCDHDDFCDKEMFSTLYSAAIKENADIVASDANIVLFNGKTELWRWTKYERHEIIASIIQPMEISKQCQKISHCIWHSIYKSSFIKDNNITFPDRSRYMDEDRLFNLQAYLSTTNIAHINSAYYTWDKHLDSASNTDSFNIAQRAINRLDFIISILNHNIVFDTYKLNVQQLIAFDLQTKLPYYKSMSEEDTSKFSDLMENADYSLCTGQFDLGFISRKRIKILLFLFQLFRAK